MAMSCADIWGNNAEEHQMNPDRQSVDHVLTKRQRGRLASRGLAALSTMALAFGGVVALEISEAPRRKLSLPPAVRASTRTRFTGSPGPMVMNGPTSIARSQIVPGWSARCGLMRSSERVTS